MIRALCRTVGLLARGRAFLDSDRSVRPLQGPRVGAVCFRHIRRRGAGVPIDDGSAYPNGTGRQRSRDMCAGSLMFQHIDAAQLLALPKAAPSRLGKGTILARYVPPWLRSTTPSSCPYDCVVSPLDIHRSRAVRLPASGRERAGGALPCGLCVLAQCYFAQCAQPRVLSLIHI